MLLRVRSNVGVWRVEVPSDDCTVRSILQSISTTRPHVVYERPLSRDAAYEQPLEAGVNLDFLTHGSMVYCRVDPATCADQSINSQAVVESDESLKDTAENAVKSKQTNMRRVIGKDGSIILVPSNEHPAEKDKGFRKGMMALRDMKMHWTLADFMALDSQFEFKIQRQENPICKQASLDIPSISNFQAYLQNFRFKRHRFGYLYGKFEKSDNAHENDPPTKALVEAIYEPPQEPDNEAAEGFQVLDDPDEERVNQIAEMLGWTRVGWIFGHDVRSDHVMTAAEIIMAAELQLEAADGVNETPFVTVKVAPGADGTVSVEAFQMSQQCMAMVAESALVLGPDPKVCNVNETFTAIQEGKESKTVENSFFLCVVPIVQHRSEQFVADFPRPNRLDVQQTHDALRRQLSKSGTAGWTFVDLLADFNLLIYLSKFLDIDADMPKICASIVDRSIPLDEGYKLIIKSIAGLEGSY
ncbi:nuclear protein localization protein 4 homolog [Fistulifera solaris]|uniref:Nuclear protein localization protein 4 homolog n=1 Tax=Fistulifera solaris TaxID=1519565 RepID=A0A1Z5JAS4_FISSO|nr:nuclear protein localization protein 4 homolog [Fistulifera solaris]|eukprot:GAX11056.1 nuclear protein localization protein 4 homolog [Fistulifera solaris]